MESVLAQLRRRLKGVGPAQWEEIAAACGVAKTLPRKIAYGDRLNPGVETIQPLISYFDKAAANDAASLGQREASGSPVSAHSDVLDPNLDAQAHG